MRILSFIIFLMLGVSSIFPQSPHGDKLKKDCSFCHESTNWKIIPKKIKFDHNTETSFKLTGQHAAVSCQSCHKSLIFSQVKSSCNSCHEDVHQNSLGPDCAKCHTPSTWIVSNIVQIHQNSRFPLIGVHLNLDCQSCHSGYSNLYFPPQSISCFSCHAKQYYATTSPNHAQANFSTNCGDCHSITSFDWGAQNIDHSFFPLVGGHNISNCFSCHKQGSNFKGLTTACYPCHTQNYMAAKNPDHVQAKFPTTCQDCHNIYSFNQANFDHSKTGFALTGAHASVTCQSCHKTGYTNTPADCYSCHSQDYANTTDPNHAAQNFPHDCTQCHSTTNWGDANFDHSTTGFALTGAHASVTCQSCHKTGYTNTSADCYSCHSQDYANTTDPNHAAQNFPHDCTQCHSTTSWGDANFDHSTTGFVLTGAHTSTTCQSCHTSGYTNTPMACFSCHQSNYQAATNPNHPAAGLPHTCQDCHNTTTFNQSTFNHTTTGFTLTGAHVSLACSSCHKGTVTGLTPDCYSCHSQDYANTPDPNHAAQNFSHDCTQCHSTTSWGDANFDHSTTGFALTGAHASVTCQSCHKTGYTNTSTDCYSCHSQDYANTTDPNHAVQNFPHDCTQCHSTTSWGDANFDHSTTGFALTGAHTTTTCQSCHTSGYTNTPTACFSCHKSNYQAATNPNHPAAGLPHTCQDCHNTTTFNQSTFNHTTTGFTLTGAHVSLACSSCHKGTVTGLTPDCYSCHSQDYANTTDPNHAAQNFPHDCTQCHSTTSWGDANFDHSTTGFALTGAHAAVTCQSCHASGYTNTPTACISCHQNDFNGTTNPAHKSAGFPTACEQCHTTTAWQPSTFNHDASYFPIYSGSHAGRWNLCADCHSTASNFSSFTCITCHEHSQANTDSHHSGVRNYVYSATSCYSCHPTGRAGD